MWKSKKLFLTLLPLFGFLLSFTSFSTVYAHDTADAPHFADEDKQMFVRSYQSSVYYQPNLKNSNIHYIIYSQKSSYSSNRDIKVYAYTCDYIDQQDYSTVRTFADCGTYLTYDQNSGVYEIRLKSAFYTDSYVNYSLKTKTFASSSPYFRDNQYQLTTFEKIISSTSDPDDYTIYLDTHNKINQFNIRPSSNFSDASNSGGGGFNIDFGAFASGIVNGISDFFKPMVRSINEVSDFISDIAKNFFKILGEAVEKLFKIEPSTIQQKTNDFRQRLESKLGTVGRTFSNIVNFFQIFVNKSNGHLQCNVHHIPIVDNPIAIRFDLCKVPPLLIQLARILLALGIMSVLLHRFLRFFNILLGSKYVWSIGSKKGEED